MEGWIRLHAQEHPEEPSLIFMQDSAPAHSARGTIDELRQRNIQCLNWPAYSPDLNPIEMVWNWMKDWIQDRYDDELRTYDALRKAIQEAWEAVPESFLQEKIEEMPERCKAVERAQGGPTRW